MDSSGHPERGRRHKRSPPRMGNGYNDPHSTAWGRRHISWLVPLFIVVSVVVFVVAMGVNNCPQHERRCVLKSLGRFSFQPLRENPLFGPSSRTLEKFGGLEWYNVVQRNQGWRLVSCIWLHAGVIHLLVCMLCLALVGIRLEQQFGYLRIGIIYLLSGFGGSILSAIFLRNRLPNASDGVSVSVGASSALFGLFGAMLSELLTNWTIYCNKVAAFITLITVVLVNLVVGILPWVDNFGHIGGFFTGLFLGFVLLMRPQFSWMERDIIPAHRGASKYNPCQLIAFIISQCLLISGFVVGLVMLFRKVNGNDHCSWCHYLSCVPTGSWNCST